MIRWRLVTDAARFARLLSLDDNPLRRDVDRVEAMAARFAILIVAALLPVCVWLGMRIHDDGLATMESQALTHYQVTAVLTHDIPPAVATSSYQQRWGEARWQTRHGVEDSGRVKALAGDKAGDTVTIWLDGDDQLAEPPLTRQQASGRAVFAAVFAYVGVVELGFGVCWLVRRRLDRIRMRSWETQWSRFAS